MRSTALTLIILLSPILAVSAAPPKNQIPEKGFRPEQMSYEIPLRLLQMPLSFTVEYNAEVRQQLTDYLRKGRRETERMLSRTALYFPIFDHYLKKYGLPNDLKYIPLLESRLRPTAESSVGAVGLWQFMPATARHYQLQIDEYVDERMNPYLATEAAVIMLSQLYQDFGDWSLVLAAYNCGPGRVRAAMRRTGCDNFWDIQHLLPRQTQRYLPALIATIYVANHYGRHGLQPNSKKSNYLPFQVFKVQHALNLNDIARHCKISRARLSRLNPGFLQDYIPYSSQGRYLILPEEVLPDFQKYIIKESRRAKERYAIAVLNSNAPLLPPQAPEEGNKNAGLPKADI